MIVDLVAPMEAGEDVDVSDVGFDVGSPDTGIDTGPICPSGQALCGGLCVNTVTSLDHCGACGGCSAPGPNMVRACQSGQCGAVCAIGFANCDGLMGNGCEVDSRTATQHCGACGRVCSPANATPTCLGGNCYITSCAAGFANCDSNEANGCETDTRSNALHCAACGRICTPPSNGTTSCVGGICVSRCNDGYIFNELGHCIPQDLVIEYVPRLYGDSIPRTTAYLNLYPSSISHGFTSHEYAVTAWRFRTSSF